MPDTPLPSPKDTAGDPESVVGFSGTPAFGRLPNNLPLELSSFVGREREMAEVETLLSEQRLLTLTGPGGSGKTRIALRVATDLLEDFEDGAWLVELAPLSDSDLVVQAVASVLGMREAPGGSLMDSLRAHLEPRETLLVLDNCEHLVGACASLAESLLRRCPRLRVIATSREALGVPGEVLLAVPPLSLPDPRRLPHVEELAGYEAARLFVERARAVKSDFEVTEANAAAVAQICYRLDGIPLAIELAAASARVLSAEQIAVRLGDSMRFLTGKDRTTPTRQRTLRGALDWSYDLLDEPERDLFGRLSVFAGGFSLEAAEEVGAGVGPEREDIVGLLSQLVHKSLVVAEGADDGLRYRMLEPVRLYGRERLGEGHEAGVARKRHAAWCLAFAQRAERGLSGSRQREWLERLETEHDNLRTALRWSLEEGNAELGLRLAAALGTFWSARGRLSEGRRWLEDAISKNPPSATPARPKALYGAGYMAYFQGEYEVAKRFLEDALSSYRKLGDKEGTASSLILLGFVALQRYPEEVPALHEELSSLEQELTDQRVAANLHLFSGSVALGRGEAGRAERLNEKALELFRGMRDAEGVSHALTNLALVTWTRGDYDKTSGFLRENLRMARTTDYKLAIQYSLLGLGSLAMVRKRFARAASLWGAAEAMEETFGIRLTYLGRSAIGYDDYLVSARSQLGEEAFAAAWDEGRAMTTEEAIEYALEEPEAPEESEKALQPAYPAGLSAREVEVLRLVSRGMTNAQIAGELYISPRTVNAHMGSVYHKIGSSTRAEATRFATEHNLL